MMQARCTSCAQATDSAASVSKQPSDEPSTSAPAPPAFTNKQRFVVPGDAKDAFTQAWQARAAHMESCAGFQGFDMEQQDSNEYAVQSQWASIPDWEAFNLSEAARRQHLPSVRSMLCAKICSSCSYASGHVAAQAGWGPVH